MISLKLSLTSCDLCRLPGIIVYTGLIYQDGREVAVKRVTTELYRNMEDKVKTLLGLRNHPNIVSYVVKKIFLISSNVMQVC